LAALIQEDVGELPILGYEAQVVITDFRSVDGLDRITTPQ
jgi:hypothetical protein